MNMEINYEYGVSLAFPWNKIKNSSLAFNINEGAI